MKIGGKYKFSEVRARHWEQFAEGAGLAKAQAKRRILELAKSLPPTARKLQSDPGRGFVSTLAADLRKPPFSADAAAWLNPTDYSATQAFARVAREANLGGIVYQSVHDPHPAWCMALLTPQAFAKPKPARRCKPGGSPCVRTKSSGAGRTSP